MKCGLPSRVKESHRPLMGHHHTGKVLPLIQNIQTPCLFYPVFGPCCFFGQLLTSWQHSSVLSGPEDLPKVLLSLTFATPVFNSLCISLGRIRLHDFSFIVSCIVTAIVDVPPIFPLSYCLLQGGPQFSSPSPCISLSKGSLWPLGWPALPEVQSPEVRGD